MRATRGERVLLVSPSLRGHRLTYCEVLSMILAHLGFETVVATNASDARIFSSPRLARLKGQSRVTVRNVADEITGDVLSLEATSAIADEIGAGVTFFAEADDILQSLVGRPSRQASGRLGRVVCLFLRSTNYIYAPRKPLPQRLRRRLRTWPGRGVDWRQAHESLLARRNLVDSMLTLDELFSREHPEAHCWLPDIYSGFDEPPPGDARETRLWAQRLAAFAASLGERPIISYVGAAHERRGYSTLLSLAVHENAGFIHCGELGEAAEQVAAKTFRAILAERGHLLETGVSYEWSETAALFLRAGSCVVLPYPNHLGSSGVMLQAIAAGRPVLVPDRGLMGYRTRAFGLGETYDEGNLTDLRDRFRRLSRVGAAPYAERLGAYASCFSREQVTAALELAVSGRGSGAELPCTTLSATAEAFEGKPAL